MLVAVRPPMAEVLNDQRTEWVRQYRHGHALADVWARGRRQVSHSTETQERAFRMAEQLAGRGVHRTDLFTALEKADRHIALSNEPHAAAEAGYRVITSLVTEEPESLVMCTGENQSNLRALGFEPLGFDGHDPAAYAWVMFELSARADAERRSRWGRCLSQAFSTPTAIRLARL